MKINYKVAINPHNIILTEGQFTIKFKYYATPIDTVADPGLELTGGEDFVIEEL